MLNNSKNIKNNIGIPRKFGFQQDQFKNSNEKNYNKKE